MADHPYRVVNILCDTKGRVKRADLTENGIVIGIVTKGEIYPYKVRFLSTQARARFDDFADSLSIGEAIEALI